MLFHGSGPVAIFAAALAMTSFAGQANGQNSDDSSTRDASASPKSQTPRPEGRAMSQNGLGIAVGVLESLPSPLTVPMVSNDSIVAVTPAGGHSVVAMDITQGSWHEYRAPEGVRLRSLMSSDVLALWVSGTEVSELAAFSTSSLNVATKNPRGTWVRQTLKRPFKGEVVPIVLDGFAYYRIGGDIYAFSAITNGWDMVHLEGKDNPRVKFGGKAIYVEDGETLYVFGAETGRWSQGLKIPR